MIPGYLKDSCDCFPNPRAPRMPEVLRSSPRARMAGARLWVTAGPSTLGCRSSAYVCWALGPWTTTATAWTHSHDCTGRKGDTKNKRHGIVSLRLLIKKPIGLKYKNEQRGFSTDSTECLKKKKLTLLNSLPNEKCKTFWGNFHMYGWLKVSSIIWHKKNLKIIYASVSTGHFC